MSNDFEEKCPSCGTYPIYKIAEKSFGCKCTYDFELEMEPSIDEIVGMVKQVRKEMAEIKGEQK